MVQYGWNTAMNGRDQTLIALAQNSLEMHMHMFHVIFSNLYGHAVYVDHRSLFLFSLLFLIHMLLLFHIYLPAFKIHFHAIKYVVCTSVSSIHGHIVVILSHYLYY